MSESLLAAIQLVSQSLLDHRKNVHESRRSVVIHAPLRKTENCVEFALSSPFLVGQANSEDSHPKGEKGFYF